MALLHARDGADVVISYFSHDDDADADSSFVTGQVIAALGGTIPG